MPRAAVPPTSFRATVHGTVFCDRTRQLDRLAPGDEVLLVPDPPGSEDPGIWVHHTEGDLIGHLPPEIGRWLVPWMRGGGRVSARAVRVEGSDAPSWRRLLVEVRCLGSA